MSNNGTCPIWGTPAERSRDRNRDGVNVISSRAGGRYFISGTAKAVVENRDDTVKARLTTWIIDQNSPDTHFPEITYEIIEQVRQRPPLPVQERANRLLKYLENKTEVIGTSAVTYRFGEITDPIVQEMFAWSESISYDEFYFLLNYLVKCGWVDDAAIKKGNQRTIVTVEGYTHLAELDAKNKDSLQGFVAMWFPDKDNKDYDLINDAYNKGIYPGIDQARYEPYRVDRDEHNDQITDKIIAEIRRSKFLVADFTHGNKGVRGGVYYEAGFARGYSIPVIYTCLKKRFSAKKIHFDILQQNFIQWTSPEDLREQLKNRITGSEIGWGPKTPPAPD